MDEYISYDEAILNLRNAIVLQAVKDLKGAYRKRWMNEAAALERFFKSDYFGLLTLEKIEGESIIDYAQECYKDRKHITQYRNIL